MFCLICSTTTDVSTLSLNKLRIKCFRINHNQVLIPAKQTQIEDLLTTVTLASWYNNIYCFVTYLPLPFSIQLDTYV
jgi:hypothetical protein